MKRRGSAKKDAMLLARLRAAPDDALSLLAEALASTAPRVVAAAAVLIGAGGLEVVGRALPDVWARFVEDPGVACSGEDASAPRLCDGRDSSAHLRALPV
jgi:hypothetical protein